jgi:NitT/TauT family transport system substrate-binding protein
METDRVMTVPRRSWKLYVAICIAACCLAGAVAFWRHQESPKEPTTISIGIATWPGFASGMVGKEKGFFEGVDLQYRTIDDLTARHAAFRNGDLDIMISSMDSWVLEKAQGLDGKVFLVTDESAGADGIVVGSRIGSIADLRGKRVAFARATPSHYLLFKALEKAGMTPADIVQVQMDDPGVAGQAFLGGKVDAAVTWEPFLTQVRDSGKGKVLVSSAEFPGTIVDVLVASPKLLQRPEVLDQVIRGWLKSVEYVKSHPGESTMIMAKGLNVKTEDAQGMMAGVRFADTARNRYFFTSNDPAKSPLAFVAVDAGKFWQHQGIISSVPEASSLISGILNEVPRLPEDDGR